MQNLFVKKSNLSSDFFSQIHGVENFKYSIQSLLKSLVFLALISVAPVLAESPMLTKIDLFKAGEGGYNIYRIPGIIVTANGTLLAYCEARMRARGDWGTIDILMRRSTDNGKTWDAPRKIAHVEGKKEKNPVAVRQQLGTDGEVTYNNAVAIADQRKGVVHFLFCLEYMRAFYMRSTNDGQTFSKPVEITQTFEKFRSEYDWKVLATGPAHGIQLKSGRLVVPVWLSAGTGNHAHRPSVTSVIYSDDRGTTWQRGEIAVPNTDEFINPNETVAVELADGSVMLNVRSESKMHRRLVTISKDGATNWSKPKFDEQLLEPICMASIVRFDSKSKNERNLILFANPHNLTRADKKEVPGGIRDRKNLSVKLSYDEGKTWTVNKPLEPGVSGYSDLAVGRDKTIYCLYENSNIGNSDLSSARLTLASFKLQWLTDNKDGAQASNR